MADAEKVPEKKAPPKPAVAATERAPATADKPLAQQAAPAAPPKPAAPALGATPPAAAPKPAAIPVPPRPKTETEDVKALLARFSAALTQAEDIDPKIPALQLAEGGKLLDVATFLQKEGRYEHLALITGIDYKTHLECVYNFFSYTKNQPIAIKIRLPTAGATLPSLTSLWATADWHERETYDLMGINFTGHPDLRRILLPEGWKGHPLRKDYDWKKEQYVGLDPDSGEDVVYQEPREGAW